MRTLEILLAICFIGSVGVVVWEVVDWTVNHLFQETPTMIAPPLAETEPEGSPAQSKLARKTPVPSPSRHSRGGIVQQPPGNQPQTNQLPVLSPPPILNFPKTAVVKPWPDVLDSLKLAIGSTRSELRKRCGTPKFEVTGTSDGTLVERYYYSNAGYNNMAVAILRNGQVVSVESVPY
jgi:hypothetical protein